MNALIGPLTDAWLALAGHLWQTSLVVGPLFLMNRILRRAPAGFVYSLWILALAKLFLPLSLIGGWAGSLILRIAPGIGLPDRSGGGSTLLMLGQVVDPGTSLGRRAGSVDPVLGVVLLLLTAAWIGGLGLIVYRFTRSSRRSSGPADSAPADGDEPVEGKLARALQGTAIPRHKILVEPGRTVPCVTGLVRPSIHVTRGLVEALGWEELRAILVHEDAHRRRREPLRIAILVLTSALLFFYPLVYFLRRRIQEAAELICDETVVRRGIRPEVYARALASTIRLGLVPAPSPVAAGVHSESFLHVRFERIHSWRRCVKMPRHYLTLGGAILLVAAGSLLPVQLLTGCARQKEAPDPAATRVADVPATPPTVTAPERDPAAPGPDEFVSVDEMPVLVTPPQPVYPEEARLQKIEGVVTIRALVDKEGKIPDCFVKDGPAPLREAALTSVKAATFKPARQDGRPVAVWVQIPIRFSLH